MIIMGILLVALVVHGPAIEKVHRSGDFGRQLFLDSLPIDLLKSGCLQKSPRWEKR